MANLILISPLAVSTISASGGTGRQNMLTPDPKEVFVDTGASELTVSIDLGIARTVDSVVLVVTAGAGDTWSVRTGVNGYDETLLGTDDTPIRLPGAPETATAVQHGAARQVRYIRLYFTRTDGPIEIGRVLVGAAVRTTWNREEGDARQPVDTAPPQRLASGGFGVGSGTVVAGLSWTWGDLSDAELEAVWRTIRETGSREPVAVVEDPAATTDFARGAFYGLLTRFERYQRRAPTRHRWSLTLEEWT